MSRIQDIDYLAVAAPLVVALTALLVLVLDALLPAARRAVSGWLALAGLATAGASQPLTARRAAGSRASRTSTSSAVRATTSGAATAR